MPSSDERADAINALAEGTEAHPYYCSESNYYVGGKPKPLPWHETPEAYAKRVEDHVPGDCYEHESWAAFSTPAVDPKFPMFGPTCCGTSDPDLNLVFRWDWKVSDSDDYEEGEDWTFFGYNEAVSFAMELARGKQ